MSAPYATPLSSGAAAAHHPDTLPRTSLANFVVVPRASRLPSPLVAASPAFPATQPPPLRYDPYHRTPPRAARTCDDKSPGLFLLEEEENELMGRTQPHDAAEVQDTSVSSRTRHPVPLAPQHDTNVSWLAGGATTTCLEARRCSGASSGGRSRAPLTNASFTGPSTATTLPSAVAKQLSFGRSLALSPSAGSESSASVGYEPCSLDLTPARGRRAPHDEA